MTGRDPGVAYAVFMVAVDRGGRSRGTMRSMDRWDLVNDPVEPHHPVVLASDAGAARAVAVNLPAGESLQEHETHEYTWVVMLGGEAEFSDHGESVEAREGFVARFAPGERREILARSDVRLLMILAPWPGDGHPGTRA